MDRLVKLAPVLLVVGLAGGYLLWGRDDGAPPTGISFATTTTAGDTTSSTGFFSNPTSSTAAGGVGGATSTTGATSSTTSTTGATTSTTSGAVATSTTTAVETGAPALPPADLAAPPSEPLGVYQDGKVVLRGSVPDAGLAERFRAKAARVLGPENVTLEMTLDPRVSGATLTIDVAEQFRFPSGSTAFDPQFEALLGLGVAALQLLPESTLVVTGHTDSVGTEATNLALSTARAQLVVDFMVNGGIAPERIVAAGAGESQPIADNATPEGRSQNRRIEAQLTGITPD